MDAGHDSTTSARAQYYHSVVGVNGAEGDGAQSRASGGLRGDGDGKLSRSLASSAERQALASSSGGLAYITPTSLSQIRAHQGLQSLANS